MNSLQIAIVVDLSASAFVFGANVWFFFVQSPVLLKKLGREQFVPIQMKLTIVLFKTLVVVLLVMFAASTLHSSLDSATTLAAGIALAAGLMNQFVVVPRALRAGGQSRAEIKSKDSEGSTFHFASKGVGERTQWLHRLVVMFVVIMLGGVAVHGVRLLVI
jgi:L-asparagine transporter-like permease